jgi:hypothetical protein
LLCISLAKATIGQINAIASEKVGDTLDVLEHLLPRWIAFGDVCCQPLAASRKQLVKGGTNLGISIKVLSGDHANSSVIAVGSRRIIAANGVAQPHEQGLQEKPVSGGHAESHT